MPIYQLPDGRKLDIPDSVPQEQAVMMLRQKFGEQKQTESATPAPKKPMSLADKIAASLLQTGGDVIQGSTAGVARLPLGVMQSGAQLAAKQFPQSEMAQNIVEATQGAERRRRLMAEEAQKESPIIGTAAETLPQALQAAPATVAGGVVRFVLGGALFGATEEAISPQEKEREVNDYLQDIGVSAGVGGLGGLGFGAMGATLGPILKDSLLGATGAVKEFLSKSKIPSQVSEFMRDILEHGTDTQAFKQLRSEIGDEGARLQQQISGIRTSDGTVVQPGLFDQAKERGKNAFVAEKDAIELSSALRKQMDEEIDPDGEVILGRLSQRLADSVQDGRISINDLESVRRAASRISRVGGSKGYIGGDVARQIDDFLVKQKDAGNIIGDEEAVNLWQRAISKRREFGDRFEKPKAIASAISDDTLETVEKAFIGRGDIAAKADLANVYEQAIKAAPSERKDAVGFLMRQSIFNRMVKRALRRSDTEEGLSADFLANQIKNFRTENKTMWNKFPDGEKKILVDLEKGLRAKTEGGPLNKVAKTTFNLLGRATRSNLEVPRTLKPKTIVDINELENLVNFKPYSKKLGILPAAGASSVSIMQGE